MNASYILFGLLSAVVGPVMATSQESAIEIRVAGPEEPRNQMFAAIRPLLGADLGIRWIAEDGIAPERVFPAAGQPAANPRQIWIDVSNPARLRVYLPAIEAQGATTIRTLARTGANGQGEETVALEAVAQIVKAAIFSLRREPAAADLSPALADGASTRPVSRHPVAAKSSDGSPSETPSRGGLYFRSYFGFGSVRASQSSSSGSFDHYGPTVGLAVGASLPKGFVLYGDLRMNGVPGGTEPAGYTANPDFVLYTFGPGVAYYFEPALYLSATLGLAKLSFRHPSTQDYSRPDPDLGYSATVTAGKAWWVSPHWAIGLAGQYSLATMSQYDVTPDVQLHVTSVSLLVSLTYN